jgi:hypothetical protein
MARNPDAPGRTWAPPVQPPKDPRQALTAFDITSQFFGIDSYVDVAREHDWYRRRWETGRRVPPEATIPSSVALVLINLARKPEASRVVADVVFRVDRLQPLYLRNRFGRRLSGRCPRRPRLRCFFPHLASPSQRSKRPESRRCPCKRSRVDRASRSRRVTVNTS